MRSVAAPRVKLSSLIVSVDHKDLAGCRVENRQAGDGDAPDQRERVVSVCTELAFATDEAERDRLIALLTATLHEGNILLDPESDVAELQSLGDDVTADSLHQLGSLFDAADATDGLSAAVLVEEKPQRKVRTHTACGHAENGEAPADVSVAEPKPHKTCMLSRRLPREGIRWLIPHLYRGAHQTMLSRWLPMVGNAGRALGCLLL